MIHNGIEYGMMQAYAEGFEIMKAKKDFGGQATNLDLKQISKSGATAAWFAHGCST